MNMKLLQEGIANNDVIKTSISRKLTIDGITSVFPVYKVKLTCLYFNDKNDRISTWISKYKAEHNGEVPNLEDRDSYNKIIEKFIYDSNPDSIKKTQANIELVDQREPGVVLNDGRIIDGNRRFTCLRRLSENNEKFGYFETVILERSIDNNAKQIKMLELSIQHGEEAKIDYNPIDRLVGVYNDIIDTKLFTVEEYARITNETAKEVSHRVDVAGLMIDFLEFINAPKQFYIARDLQIAATLEELPDILHKCQNEDEREDIKIIDFTNLLMHPSGEMRAFQRNLRSIIGSDYCDEFIDDQKEIAEEVIDTLPKKGEATTAVIRETVRTNEELTNKLEASMEKTLTKTKKDQTRNEPIRLAEKATTFLQDIDQNIITKMNDSEVTRLKRQLSLLEKTIEEIKGNL